MEKQTYLQPSCKLIILQLEHIVATSIFPELEEVYVDDNPYLDPWD